MCSTKVFLFDKSISTAQPRREDGTRIVPYQDRSHDMTMERHVVTFFCAHLKSQERAFPALTPETGRNRISSMNVLVFAFTRSIN